METQTQTKTSGGAKDFFINLGAIVALYTLIGSWINLLFTVINEAYPQVTSSYGYYGNSASISWPVSILIIFAPILMLMMWLMEKEYEVNPERKNGGMHKWLTYITLFISGVALAIDLITVLYYFIDGQDLTMAFLLKVLVVLIVAGSVFTYYISDIRGKLTSKSRNIWRIVVGVFVIGSIAWGFSVLGSPYNQRLYKYDDQKINDLSNIKSTVSIYFEDKNILPKNISEMSSNNYYMSSFVDSQTQQPYEYEKTSETTYNLCAVFNKESRDFNKPNNYYFVAGYESWTHPVGRHCFNEMVNPSNLK